ncbi:lysozyme C-like [Homalodisca vitripennis]|uniref:lysozyme C-like n=1 Tax=Homalodisca vitripennis TaxID=197043 RepID=UPI001EEC59A8|nr:lysozyme C-like [Homalodisca vitripennis]
MRCALLAVLLAQQAFCRVFERCELVRELSQKKHRIPEADLATWVCIARYESEYNTSAVGHLNGDGSGDHGLLQISDLYWCSPPGVGMACGLNCDQLEDDDITDDVVCARRIYRAHKRRTGDGFTAWAVYGRHCRGDVSHFLEGCEDSEDENEISEKDVKVTPDVERDIAPTTFTDGRSTSTPGERILRVFSNYPTTNSVERQKFYSTSTQPKVFATSSLQGRPTFSDLDTTADPDPKTAWLKVHYDPRFLDEFP